MAHDMTDTQSGTPKKKWVTPEVKQIVAGSAENATPQRQADNPTKLS